MISITEYIYIYIYNLFICLFIIYIYVRRMLRYAGDLTKAGRVHLRTWRLGYGSDFELWTAEPKEMEKLTEFLETPM